MALREFLLNLKEINSTQLHSASKIAANYLQDTYSSLPKELLEEWASNFHAPLYVLLAQKIHQLNHSPITVGVSAPQGFGKTLLLNLMEFMFEYNGLRCISMSIDDFYLTYAQQKELSLTYQNNPLLQGRGNPGTHDLSLCIETINSLKQHNTESSDSEKCTLVPLYDKFAQNKRGDRMHKGDWRVVKGHIDIILIDGWMLGFSAEINESLLSPNLIDINSFLKHYTSLQDSLINYWIVIEPKEIDYVYHWREQQEQLARIKGKKGLTPCEVKAFIHRFLPIYEEYQRKITVTPGIKILVDKERHVLSVSLLNTN